MDYREEAKERMNAKKRPTEKIRNPNCKWLEHVASRYTPLKIHPREFCPERPRRCRGYFFAKVYIHLQPALT
jgi:hypothetical protein